MDRGDRLSLVLLLTALLLLTRRTPVKKQCGRRKCSYFSLHATRLQSVHNEIAISRPYFCQRQHLKTNTGERMWGRSGAERGPTFSFLNASPAQRGPRRAENR